MSEDLKANEWIYLSLETDHERYYLDNKDIWAAHFDISVINRSVCFLSGLTQTCYGFERNKLAVHIMWSIILRLAIEWNIIIWVAIHFWIYQDPMKPVNNCHFLFFVDIFPNRTGHTAGLVLVYVTAYQNHTTLLSTKAMRTLKVNKWIAASYMQLINGWKIKCYDTSMTHWETAISWLEVGFIS